MSNNFRVMYVWQSDSPNSTNRGFIRDVLDRAAKAINVSEKYAVNVIIDQDTQDLPGMPVVQDAILKKIRTADAVVVDLTFVAQSSDGRSCSNPNALIELGYALASPGPDRMVCVMNEAFGPVEQQVFDLQNRRRPIAYELYENAPNKSVVRKELSGAVQNALEAIIAFGSVVPPIEEETPNASALTPGCGETPILPPIPPNLIELIPTTATYVFFGNSFACTDKFPFDIIRQRGEPMVTLDRNDGSLLLSAKVFDKRGKILCEIVENVIHTNHNNVFRIERDSIHRLAVIDDELRRVLDIEYINPRTIRFLGDFHMRRGTHATISNDILEFKSDDYLLAVTKPLVFLDNELGYGLGFDFPDDKNAPPELELSGAVVHNNSIRWIGPNNEEKNPAVTRPEGEHTRSPEAQPS